MHSQFWIPGGMRLSLLNGDITKLTVNVIAESMYAQVYS